MGETKYVCTYDKYRHNTICERKRYCLHIVYHKYTHTMKAVKAIATFMVTAMFSFIVIMQNNFFNNNNNNNNHNRIVHSNNKKINKFRTAKPPFFDHVDVFDHNLLKNAGRKILDNDMAVDERLSNIPKVIHQTWKKKNVPKWARLPVKSWKRLNPEFTYKLYNDEDMEKYVEKYYPKILNFYKNNMKPVQRSDVFRYVVIYAEGGIYADIDTTCAVPIHKWLTYTENKTKLAPSMKNNVNKLLLRQSPPPTKKYNFIVGFEAIQKKPGWEKYFAAEFQLCQWTFAAKKKHWLLKHVLDRIFEYYDNGKHLKSKSIIKSTGPGIWSYAMNDAFKMKYNITFGVAPFNHEMLGKYGAKVGDDILVLPTSSFGRPFGGIGSSDNVLIWHGFQGSWKSLPYQSHQQHDDNDDISNGIYDNVLNG